VKNDNTELNQKQKEIGFDKTYKIELKSNSDISDKEVSLNIKSMNEENKISDMDDQNKNNIQIINKLNPKQSIENKNLNYFNLKSGSFHSENKNTISNNGISDIKLDLAYEKSNLSLDKSKHKNFLRNFCFIFCLRKIKLTKR